jgi:hypothetical protein
LGYTPGVGNPWGSGSYVEELVVRSIELSNGLVGHPLDTVCPVFIDSYTAITWWGTNYKLAKVLQQMLYHLVNPIIPTWCKCIEIQLVTLILL